MLMLSLCSFSGGKDSCLALWRAQRSGLEVKSLLVMFEESGERSRSHALPLALIRRQAAALMLDLRIRNASWSTYEAQFVGALKQYRDEGFTSAVFGDIDLQPHRDWEERVCGLANIEPVLPLWLEKRDALSREVLAEGFKAVVVCTDSRYLGPEFCGREYDAAFIADLPPHVDACGENGEFHTFVYDGPNFSKPVPFEMLGFEDYVAPPEFGGVRYRFAKLR
jgi:diphthine-ammonia ligase